LLPSKPRKKRSSGKLLHIASTTTLYSVPQRLKKALGQLINAPAEDIILGNTARIRQ